MRGFALKQLATDPQLESKHIGLSKETEWVRNVLTSLISALFV